MAAAGWWPTRSGVEWLGQKPRSSRTDIRVASRGAPRHCMRWGLALWAGRSLWTNRMHKRNETDEIETDASPRPKPLDELGGSHKWESGGRISLPCDRQSSRLHWPHGAFLRCKLFAKRQIHTVSKAACFRSRKDGAATDGMPMNHGPAPAAGARRKPPGGADCGDRALW